ncbi:hypothetical protein AAFF_G00146380 [Aldrovandia affinis]|uniref:Uncharacterized protein n=1 Tax=Aldrovandia affinis TaxID=143900 RepID=A0AAD7RQ87_9TELE|nr:hypothetical protein AAFF_G00146380 [Aldrovandia affinis]
MAGNNLSARMHFTPWPRLCHSCPAALMSLPAAHFTPALPLMRVWRGASLLPQRSVPADHPLPPSPAAASFGGEGGRYLRRVGTALDERPEECLPSPDAPGDAVQSGVKHCGPALLR